MRTLSVEASPVLETVHQKEGERVQGEDDEREPCSLSAEEDGNQEQCELHEHDRYLARSKKFMRRSGRGKRERGKASERGGGDGIGKDTVSAEKVQDKLRKKISSRKMARQNVLFMHAAPSRAARDIFSKSNHSIQKREEWSTRREGQI